MLRVGPAQTHTGWEHIVVVDGGPLRADLLNSIAGPKRTVICLGESRRNFGNTPRHIGWKLVEGDYSIYLDDDNYFAHDEALADIARSLDEARPDLAVFPFCASVTGSSPAIPAAVMWTPPTWSSGA